MFQFQQIELTDTSKKYYLSKQGQELQYIDFIRLLKKDLHFRTFFINLLSEISYPAYRWETPPVRSSTLHQSFEFVIHNSPQIDLPPNPLPFRSYFTEINNENGVAVFNNLGGDAKLMAPASSKKDINYSHLAVFTKNAPVEQQQVLWQTVGKVVEEQLSDHPLWLNTAGGGVAWLHIRLDSRPKYYHHRPYTEFD